MLKDDPAESWSTGTDPTVNSEYTRLLTRNPALAGHGYNDAKTGAKMSALDGQLLTAGSQHVAYVTVLMGANDVCTSSIGTMTPTATFSGQFKQALTDFTAADSTATVFVSSIPNIYRLWSTLHTNYWARVTWSSFGICTSMLAGSNTEAQRQQVLAQENADNKALASVCAQFPQCRWDGLATYNVNFPASDVSTVDYFHPNVAGQTLLATTAWNAGPWSTR